MILKKRNNCRQTIISRELLRIFGISAARVVAAVEELAPFTSSEYQRCAAQRAGFRLSGLSRTEFFAFVNRLFEAGIKFV